MIFVTVGTQLPFNRLARAVDAWCDADRDVEVFAQLGRLGPDDYRPRNFEWTQKLSPRDFETQFRRSSVVAGHAGMGTIIASVTASKPLLVMPRRSPLEHRNDHQVATVKSLSRRLGVRVAMDEPDVSPALEELLALESGLPASPLAPFAEESLIECVREQIWLTGEVVPPPRGC